MGVPSFYRWLLQRYPKAVAAVDGEYVDYSAGPVRCRLRLPWRCAAAPPPARALPSPSLCVWRRRGSRRRQPRAEAQARARTALPRARLQCVLVPSRRQRRRATEAVAT